MNDNSKFPLQRFGRQRPIVLPAGGVSIQPRMKHRKTTPAEHGMPPIDWVCSMSLPEVPERTHTLPNGEVYSNKLLGGGEISFGVDARCDEATKLKVTRKMLLEQATAMAYASTPELVRPFAEEACDIAADENDLAFHRETNERLSNIEKHLPSSDGIHNHKTHLRYPQDAEALALLDAAAKLKTKLAKKDQKITNEAVIQALLDEPDGRETKNHKDQRLKYQYRVWYGAVKNGMRKNKTATPPKQLDSIRRAVTWKKFYKDWGKHLSCYMKHPSAK